MRNIKECIINKYERINYRPQTKLRKGNVFASVCQGFCLWGCIPACTGADTLPSWADTPGQTLPGQTPPLGRHPWAGTLPGQTPPCPVHTGIHTPAQCMLGYPPPSTDSHYSRRYASYWNAFLLNMKEDLCQAK